jgi:hypothetical protein
MYEIVSWEASQKWTFASVAFGDIIHKIG